MSRSCSTLFSEAGLCNVCKYTRTVDMIAPWPAYWFFFFFSPHLKPSRELFVWKFPDHRDYIRPKGKKRTAVLQHAHRPLIYLKVWMTKRAATEIAVMFEACCHCSATSELLNKGFAPVQCVFHHYPEFLILSATVHFNDTLRKKLQHPSFSVFYFLNFTVGSWSPLNQKLGEMLLHMHTLFSAVSELAPMAAVGGRTVR